MSCTTYKIEHTTTYSYESPVRICHNIVMLYPRSSNVVQPSYYRITVKPHPETLVRREDYFGNQLHSFSLNESHKQLVVSASGRVKVSYAALVEPSATEAWEMVREAVDAKTDRNWFDACQYRFPSPRIDIDARYASFARRSFLKNRPIVEAALDLTQRIFREFKYDAEATEVYTPTAAAFEMRHGVCQDFAHVQIACLRSIGLSARYVSGYLRTVPPPGKEKLIGADQSHAWVSLYCGQTVGWVDLDPTNNRSCDTDHIPIAWGRDYNDVIPVRGVFLGGGEHSIQVSVDVQELPQAVSAD